MQRPILGIDWGTSNRRSYLIDQHGTCQAMREDEQGILAIKGGFLLSLVTLLNAMEVRPGVPVVMSGMVGSANGWHEVPYLDTSVDLNRLPSFIARVDAPDLGRACFIVPGYCQRDGTIDVMRGEETQLLGAITLGQGDGWVVLPGTHSKWVRLRNGAIDILSTYMTGELFGALAAKGTLSSVMGKLDDASAFEAGVHEARLRAPLTNALFRVRARVVSGAMPAVQARSFVSGLLIGTEFIGAMDSDDRQPLSISLICSNALYASYAAAAALFGMEVRQLDPHLVYTAALSRFADEVSA